jgi:hypothetical protein
MPAQMSDNSLTTSVKRPKYESFGKYMVNVHDLRKNVVNLKYKKTGAAIP